jgi:hypothetical protein
MSPTAPHTPAEHHYIESEQILASLGALGIDGADLTREVLVALVHALHALAGNDAGRRDTMTRRAWLSVILAWLLLAALAIGVYVLVAVVQHAPTHQPAPPPTVCPEDDPCWTCSATGNHHGVRTG